MSLVEDLSSRRRLVSATGHPSQSGLPEVIADWCSCLEGRLPLVVALKGVAEGLGARAVCLSRHYRLPGGLVRAVISNASIHKRAGVEVSRSFASCVLGRFVERLRPASVWFSSSKVNHDEPALELFHRRAGIAETVVVVLALEEKWADYLEIHFARVPSHTAQDLLKSLACMLSRTWIRCPPGFLSDAIRANQAQARPSAREPILSFSNPARLSRAEFRVCVLLSRGLKTESVCSELSISHSTLKVHLRNIFSKTEVTSIEELLSLLLAPSMSMDRPSDAAPLRRT